jgi:hypothetical protein
MEAKHSRVFLITFIGILVGMIWPALWNRSPFYFPDTRTYIRSADAPINRLTKIRTEWTALDTSKAPTPVVPSKNAMDSAANDRFHNLSEMTKRGILLGRSPYYGLLLYVGTLTGGFWLTILLQSALALLVVYLSVRTFELPIWPTLPLVALGLCAFSDLPFFTSYLMPDLFAGIAIIACGLLIGVSEYRTPSEYGLLLLLLTAAMLCHDSCLIISLVMLALAAVDAALRRSFRNWRGIVVILLAVAFSMVGQSVVVYGIERVTHEAPLRLPFLSARLVADGPGTNFLRATCPDSRFVLCEYVSEFPLPHKEFLFGRGSGHSVFDNASYKRREEISKEQSRFVLAVFRYDPMGVIRSASHNFVQQLTDFGLSDFSYPDDRGMKEFFPEPAGHQMLSSRSYQGTLDISIVTRGVYLSAILCCGFLAVVWRGAWGWRQTRNKYRRIVLWVVIGIVINAAVCGCLSGVDSRYQARVIWLLPLVCLLCGCHFARSYREVAGFYAEANTLDSSSSRS